MAGTFKLNNQRYLIKTHNWWEEGALNHYFTEPSSFLNILYPLLNALDWKGDFLSLVESLPHYSKNLNLTHFLNVMAELGFGGETLQTQLNSVTSVMLPAVWLNKKGEVFLIQSISNGKIQAYSGDQKKEVTLENMGSKGTLLYFSDLAEQKTQLEGLVENGFIYSVFKRFQGLITQVLLLTFVQTLFITSIPLYIMVLYDKVIPATSMAALFDFLIGVLIFIISAQYFQRCRTRLMGYLAARLDKTTGEAILAHILHLPPQLTENNTIGAQFSKLKEFGHLKDFFISPLAVTLCELPFTIIYILITAAIGGWLVVIPLIIIFLFLLSYYLFSPLMQDLTQNVSKELSRRQTFLLETFDNMRHIKSSGKQYVWLDRHHTQQVYVAELNYKQSFYTNLMRTISNLFMMLSGTLSLGFGAYQVMSSQLSLGALIAVMLLSWKVLGPMKMLLAYLPVFDQVKNTVSQLDRLFKIKEEAAAHKESLAISDKPAKVEFNRVIFKYQNNLPPAILGVDFVVEPGEQVCIAGNNSAGKTTLLKLILGFYQPQGGLIRINDVNVQQLNPMELRQHIAYMPQTIQTFYGTIKQNMSFGNIAATPEEIEIAARLADIHDDILALSNGYNTLMDDNASQYFSVGFLQRLMLARTYLKKSSITLFDEPANHLDSTAEKKLIKVFQNLKKETTIFHVTHRPSYLKAADKILYLVDGQVLLFGTPEQVLPNIPEQILTKDNYARDI